MAYAVWNGLPKVLQNLNAQVRKIQGRTLIGLIRGASIIKDTMDSMPPVIPVDTGNMRHSWFVVTNKGGVRAGKNPSFLPGPYNDRDVAKLKSDHAKAISVSASMIKGKEPAVALGFSAYYAMWVHENVGAHFTKPGSGAKFFEAGIKNSAKRVLMVIQSEAKIR